MVPLWTTTPKLLPSIAPLLMMVLKFNLTVHLFSSEVPFWQLGRWICFIFNGFKIGQITLGAKLKIFYPETEMKLRGILNRPFSIRDYLLQVKALQEVWKSHLRQRTSSQPNGFFGPLWVLLSLYRKKSSWQLLRFGASDSSLGTLGEQLWAERNALHYFSSVKCCSFRAVIVLFHEVFMSTSL